MIDAEANGLQWVYRMSLCIWSALYPTKKKIKIDFQKAPESDMLT